MFFRYARNQNGYFPWRLGAVCERDNGPLCDVQVNEREKELSTVVFCFVICFQQGVYI